MRKSYKTRVLLLHIGSKPNMNVRVLAGSQTLITTRNGGILVNGKVGKFVIDQEDLGSTELNHRFCEFLRYESVAVLTYRLKVTLEIPGKSVLPEIDLVGELCLGNIEGLGSNVDVLETELVGQVNKGQWNDIVIETLG